MVGRVILQVDFTTYTDAITGAFSAILTPEGMFFILIGTCIGLIFGAIPGLGGSVALTLLIPITFGMDTSHAFMLLSSALGGVAFGGALSAILINVPGTAPNAATLLDGHPMARQGRASEAIGAAAFASALGALVGLAVLMITIPFVRQLLLHFGPPEYFMLTVMGIAIVSVSLRTSAVNGLIAGVAGFALSFVGFSIITGGSRYTFGSGYLTDGIGVVQVVIGIFAISEMILLYTRNQTISEKGIEAAGSVIEGARSVFRNFPLFLEASFIGIVVGMLPGAGGTIANFIAYARISERAPNNENFGNGDIRGVIASEASNDAKDGGAILPTVAFGIPGTASWAVMLGAFVLHGIQPGPLVISQQLELVFIIIFSLAISNILTSAIGILLKDQLIKVTTTPISILIPTVIVISLYAAYALRSQILDVITVVILGITGYFMIKYDYSRVTFILGVILGPLAESSFIQSLQISKNDPSIFVTRPISLLLLVITVLTLLKPALEVLRERGTKSL